MGDDQRTAARQSAPPPIGEQSSQFKLRDCALTSWNQFSTAIPASGLP